MHSADLVHQKQMLEAHVKQQEQQIGDLQLRLRDQQAQPDSFLSSQPKKLLPRQTTDESSSCLDEICFEVDI